MTKTSDCTLRACLLGNGIDARYRTLTPSWGEPSTLTGQEILDLFAELGWGGLDDYARFDGREIIGADGAPLCRELAAGVDVRRWPLGAEAAFDELVAGAEEAAGADYEDPDVEGLYSALGLPPDYDGARLYLLEDGTRVLVDGTSPYEEYAVLAPWYLFSDGVTAEYGGRHFAAGDADAALEAWVQDGDYGQDAEEEPKTVFVAARWRRQDGAEGSLMVGVEPAPPRCACSDGHVWEAPHELVGGLEDNPGVFGHGGGVVAHRVCLACGTERLDDSWATDPASGVQGLASVQYRPYALQDEVRAYRARRAESAAD
ncbi:MAG: hypothetical protein ABFD65_03130 [Candidatus Polarisedimenticolia bacterium]